jgi:hypothetical protein
MQKANLEKANKLIGGMKEFLYQINGAVGRHTGMGTSCRETMEKRRAEMQGWREEAEAKKN